MTQEPIIPIAVRPSSAFIPRGLHGQIVEHLGSQIVSGAIKPDALLQTEQIGAAYGASRTVIREALRVLENKGLIFARPNVGTHVRPLEQWNLLDADVVRWRAAAHLEEPVDHDVFVFTAHLRVLQPTLAGNLLYELLMENLTGVPRAKPEDAGNGTQTPECAAGDEAGCDAAASREPTLEEDSQGLAEVELAEAAA